MNFEAFQNLARLYVVGALDEEDAVDFEKSRLAFGAEAEAFILECERLNAAFALSLRPLPPQPDTKQRLLDRIREGRGKA